MATSVTGLLLAGGDGSRMLSDGVETPKLLLDVHGRPLLGWSIDLLRTVVDDLFVMVDEHSDAIEQLSGALGTSSVHVPKSSPAAKVVAGANESCSDLVMVASGDTLVSPESMALALDLHAACGTDSTMVLARQPHLTDSQWSAESWGPGARLVEAPEGSTYERAAWICNRAHLVDAAGTPTGDGEVGLMGYELGSVNSLFTDLQRNGVSSGIVEVDDIVVNVNRKRDVARAAEFVAALSPDRLRSTRVVGHAS